MEALLYFALWAGLIFLMMRFGCGAHVMGHGRGRHGSHESGGARDAETLHWVPPDTDVDPVCGKTVRPEAAKPSVHDGIVYYFCSGECRGLFEAAPEIYLRPKAASSPEHKDHVHG
ncbi:YHS domain-containing protein [Desertibaculum subflavum]|uniref:YHS domain-containing protein n=1 Tax=Desertibaculum subflavum TaxID=2268458 RepID=UPI000E67012B